jgi:hypothetical protein
MLAIVWPVMSSPPGSRPESNLYSGERAGFYSVLMLGLVLGLGLVILVVVSGRQWFIADDWAFIAPNGTHDGPTDIWLPHNEHWSTIPILVYRVLRHLYGVRTYAPYLVPLYAVHLGLATLLWIVMRRAGVGRLIATSLTAVFVVLGGGSENLLWAFQFGFVGAVMLGVLAVVLVDSAKLGWIELAGAVVALLIGLMFSSTVLPLVAVAAFVAWVRRGPRAALVIAGIPAAVYTTWLLWVGRAGLEHTTLTLRGFLQVPRYVWTGLIAAVERPTGLEGAGAIIILALGVWLLRSLPARGPVVVPAALAMGAVFLYVLVAPGRVSFGLEQATAGRYIYIAWGLLLPAVALALNSFVNGNRLRLGGAMLLVLFMGVQNLNLLYDDAIDQAGVEAVVRGRILAAAGIGRSGDQVFDVQPEPGGAPDLTMSGLSALDRAGKLPKLTGLGERSYIDAAANVQLNLGTEIPVGVEPLPEVAYVSRASIEASPEPGCVVVRRAGPVARVALSVSKPSGILLRASSGDTLGLALQSPDRSLTSVPMRTLPFQPGSDVPLDIGATDYLTLVELPHAPSLSVCGVMPPARTR